MSEQFTTSKVFQTYGLSNNIDAHMLTNLEWGAVSYLTHSKYGLCEDSNFRDTYINNSSGHYTGRSGGALSGSDNLNLSIVYSESTTSTDKYNTTGYYTYKGFFIDYNGNITTTKDTSKIVSTTGNITGVYDMSGGAYEYVMGNMVDSSGSFYPSNSGTSWNESATLDNKYYNNYSYGEASQDQKQAFFNRSRLGDATAENTSNLSVLSSAWKSGYSINQVFLGFVYNEYSWIQRGGYYDGNKTDIGILNMNRNTGNATSNDSFRSSLT